MPDSETKMHPRAHAEPGLGIGYWLCIALAVLLVLFLAAPVHAQTFDDLPNLTNDNGESMSLALPDVTDPENLPGALQIVVMLTVLSLAPSILVMMTSFTRIVIVLSLVRQAIGTQSLPPNQVLVGLSLFMTIVVMGPTWNKVNQNALQPYLNGEITQQAALDNAVVPMRDFMIAQIEASGSDAEVQLFHAHATGEPAETWDEVSTFSLIPGFMLSELKTAFWMGFLIYLPFLIVDMVISAVLISMGMMMLPPVLISLPFKLLLFVLADGWTLMTASLMESFVT
ncbi:MAG: flagellar type III secretion system pore protein FliP [Planctomycetota bacterium]